MDGTVSCMVHGTGQEPGRCSSSGSFNCIKSNIIDLSPGTGIRSSDSVWSSDSASQLLIGQSSSSGLFAVQSDAKTPEKPYFDGQKAGLQNTTPP
ncbi:hypothetical protein SODALDRAFT_359864 [Sodiomyces alkalinus F11]|uniref:Uncharacterized protein n=1 Tax=Sodiomyces alkalinus (strain CBS 110278 / VKM F-3762 / F11) TaxID=1314773 RepID=A0A3N2PW95_SODAK|nr:hypothetical protein SODALDRAFT_359864 [Sodiomyces alkalinus F11]ROT38757.1 hypothetical protein SODALDRAFT_359864 [Sodiomyces alkalinus F11]